MLSHPTLKKAGTFRSLAAVPAIQSYLPYAPKMVFADQPKRKWYKTPIDNDTFVKPIKQCFVKNPRLMPMTRLMLTLIAGWAGQGTSISTTTGIIAKHLRRSRRQVFRYLKDAMEEGYLSYCKTKGRSGLYTGIKIWLNFGAIRFTRFQKKNKTPKTPKSTQSRTKSDVPLMSDTNTKQIYNKWNTQEDEKLMKALLSFGATLGYFEKKKQCIESDSMIISDEKRKENTHTRRRGIIS
ncbi:MAG: hypothetical protein AAF849_15450 [Bacteroidota bacterium]